MKQHLNPMKLSARMMWVVALSLSSCSTFGDLTKVDLNELTQVVEMSKSPCYGRCPVFRLTIYENGIVSFDGERYTERVGLWVKELEAERYDEILRAFRKANLWRFRNVYRGEYYDAPTVSITYYEEGDVKTIVGKDGRPYQVLELEAMLDNLARSEGWMQIGGESGNYGLPENIIANELIVQLREGHDGNRWVRQYRKQEMEVLERVSPSGNYWRVRYNPDIKSPEEMLAMVRRDLEVVGAEFNKKLELR